MHRRRSRGRLRVGVLELLTLPATTLSDRVYHALLTKQFGSVMPQAVAAWSRRLGHDVSYAIYTGQGDPDRLLPRDLDVVFVSCHTQASPLAYAMARVQGARGAVTVLGGPHARAFPRDCGRFFDLVCGDCDAELVGEILSGQIDPGSFVTSGRPLREIPSVEERLPEIRSSSFYQSRFRPPVCVVPMLASTGCPYRCDFCIDWDNPYQQLPLDRFEADLRFLSERLPGVGMAIHDPNFAVKFDPVLDVMERIPEGRRPGYVMESSLSVLKGERLGRLRRTNCAAAAPGVESWSGYSRKSGVGRTTGGDKVDQVADHLAELHEAVPYLQVNLMFGLDGDRGEEPVELTRNFLDRTPFAWPALNIPVPFGGTPFHDALKQQGRILETLPFAFYYAPYLAMIPLHYDPVGFYDRLIALFEHALRPRLLAARLAAARTKTVAFVQWARTASSRSALGQYREIRDLLRHDRELRRFHEGASVRLPAFYSHKLDGMLGRYASLISAEERVPWLGDERPKPMAAVLPD